MGEAAINKKRDAIELCRKLIPLMKEEEINSIMIILNAACDRIIKDVE
jgi:hypothetical protein